MYTNNRDEYRNAFYVIWKKHQQKFPLEPVESQLVQVMLQHPEYHALLEKADTLRNQEFAIEENPFFHMSLHHALQEQIKMNRPAGMMAIYQQLILQMGDWHAAEHCMMKCLYEMMRRAQETGEMPGDETYLAALQQISGS